jgi:hypothetical protein
MICKGTNILGSRKEKRGKAIPFTPKTTYKRSLSVKKSEKNRK